MSVERMFEGESRDGSLQKALEDALHRLAADLGEGGFRDASATWVVSEIAGEHGGFAGLHSVTVRISTIRTPEWGLAQI